MPNQRTQISEAASATSHAPRSKDVSRDIRPPHFELPTSKTTLTAEERLQVEEFAFLFGNSPESYDIVSSSGSILRLPRSDGFLNVHVDKRFWHIPGGIIADDGKKSQTVEWLKQQATQQRQTVAVYSVSSEEVPLFHQAGFAVNKFGEEAIIDLGNLDWSGKSFEWVRRQTNFCLRHGLEVIEITCAAEQRKLADELIEVFFDDLRDRMYSQPLHLLEGQFDPHCLGRRRLFVARHQTSHRTEGFLVVSPMHNGTSWAFETYRKRRDAVRGTIPYLFREVTDRLQAEGIRRVSLCLIPGKGIRQDHSKSADARVSWLLGLWYGRLNLLFSASGQDYFKSRFRPRHADRYICVYPRNSWTSIISFLRVSGALRINVWNAIRTLAGATKRTPKQRQPNS